MHHPRTRNIAPKYSSHCSFALLTSCEYNGKMVILAYFSRFLQILSQLKYLFQNLSARIIFVIDATFVPHLTFSGLLSPEILFGDKTVTHSDTQLILPSVNLRGIH